VLASLRLRVLGGSSVAAEDETEDSEPVRRDSNPHNAVGYTREAATAQVVRSVTGGEWDRWARIRPSPEEFDKVQNPLNSANALGCLTIAFAPLQDATALGHLDAVAALTSLRCRVYGIRGIDTLQVQKVHRVLHLSERFFVSSFDPTSVCCAV
jgi:hypothetical protein